MSWAHTEKMISAEWSPPRVERLIELWASGLSASQCASAMGNGVTRNAVIGKIHRLKLPKRKKTSSSGWSAAALERSKRRSEARKAQRPRAVVSRKPIAPKMPPLLPMDDALLNLPVWTALPDTTPVSLMDLTADTCRWPIGDPTEHGSAFCGCTTAPGSSYCSTHRVRSVGKGTSLERAAEKVLRIKAHFETRVMDQDAA